MLSNKDKIEKLKQLSPLAAAIAFAASLPAQINAQDFTIDNSGEGGAQANLDSAISIINGENSDSHSIIFSADVSGPLFLNNVSLYDGGSLTIDGTDASNLELKLDVNFSNEKGIYLNDANLTISNVDLTIEGEGTGIYLYEASANINNVDITVEGEGTGIYLYQASANINNVDLTVEGESAVIYARNSDLDINDLALTINKNNVYSSDQTFSLYDSDFDMNNATIDVNSNNSNTFSVFHAFYYSSLTLDDVSADFADSATAINALNTDLTISNSSFSSMASYDQGISVYNYSTTSDINITGSRFEDNNSSQVLSLSTGQYGSLNVTLDDLSFDSNTSTAYNGSIVNVETVTYGWYSQEINITLTNSTFSNNESEGAILNFENNYEGSNGDNSINAGIGNVTFANNTTKQAVLNVSADYVRYGTTEINLAMAHVTLANNGPVNSSYAYSGLEVYNGNYEGEGNSINLSMINSIITNNEGSGGEANRGLEGEVIIPISSSNSNIYSNIDINIDNSLIGDGYDQNNDGVDGEGVLIGANNIFGEDPLLGDLADNGGSTLTMLPEAASPVIDAGDADFAEKLDVDLELLFDQRDEDRVRGDAPDMGAVEVVPAGEKPTDRVNKKKKKSFFGSIGFGSLIAAFGLLGLRRKRK